MQVHPRQFPNGRGSNGNLPQRTEHNSEAPYRPLINHRERSETPNYPEPLEGDRIGIFIDGSNLFYAAMQLGIEIDYAKLLCKLTNQRRLLRAYFYTGVDRSNDRQQNFLLWMRRNGYRVVTKDLIQLPDGSKKANLDVEIAVDMITLASYCDTMILLSGDGDLAYAVNSISYLGTQVEVVSLQAMTSDALINVADRYTDLAAIKEEIQKDRQGSF